MGFRAKVAVRLGGKRVREARGSPEPIQSGHPHQGRVMDSVPVSAVERAHFLMCFLRNLGRARPLFPLHDHTSERQFLIFGVYETTEPYPLGLRSRSPARSRNQNQNGNLWAASQPLKTRRLEGLIQNPGAGRGASNGSGQHRPSVPPSPHPPILVPSSSIATSRAASSLRRGPAWISRDPGSRRDLHVGARAL